jgi:hypothetical protein
MKRILLSLLVALAFAVPSFGAATGPRDIQPPILAMFRAMVADLSDFDPGLCGTSGTFGLISTDGEWTCEDPAEAVDPDLFLQHDGVVNDMNRAICGHNTVLNNCTTYNWYINPLGGGYFETVLSDNFALGTQHLDEMSFGFLGKPVENFFFIGDVGYLTLSGDGTVLTAKGTAAAPSHSFHEKPDTGMWLNEIGDNLDFSIDGVSIINLQPALMRISQPIWQIYGTVDKPSYTFHDDPDTGMYAPWAGAIDFAVGGVMRLRIDTGTVTSTVPFRAQDGIQGTPSYSFTSDPNTGMYRLSDGTIRFSSNNVAKLEIKAADVKVFDNLLIVDGTDAAPGIAFSSDGGTGMYRVSASTLGWAVGGVQAGYFEYNSGTPNLSVAWNVLAGNGVNAQGYVIAGSYFSVPEGDFVAPSIRFTDDHNTGIYQLQSGNDTIAFTTGGALAMALNANGSMDLTATFSGAAGANNNATFHFTDDPNTGVYSHENDGVSLVAGGIANVRVTPTYVYMPVELWLKDGAVGDPSLASVNEATTGMYFTTGNIHFAETGVLAATLNTAGLTLAGSLTANGFMNSGDDIVGTLGTFAAADTTPNPAGSAYWKTGSAVTITNFNGGSYTDGQVFVLEVHHNITIDCIANNIYCGNVGNINRHYEVGDFVTFIQRSDGYWAILSESFGATEQTIAFTYIGATIAVGNGAGVFRAPQAAVNPTLTRLSCVATGATTGVMALTLEECDNNLENCVVTNATLGMDENNKAEADSNFTNAELGVGGWWKFKFTSVTTAPEMLHCEISYATS